MPRSKRPSRQPDTNRRQQNGKQRATASEIEANARQQQPIQPRKRPEVNFQFLSDDEAKADWRAQKPPTEKVTIPTDLAIQDRSFQRIVQDFGCFIFLHDPTATTEARVYGIWGNFRGAKAAKLEVLNWVQSSGYSGYAAQSRGKQAFAKVRPLDVKKRQRAEKHWITSVKRVRFRQHPPAEMAFNAIGSFHWPIDDYNPYSVFGKSLEALDPIRMDSSCYVVYHEDWAAFRVMGKEENVKLGLQRLRRTYFQLTAQQTKPVRKYFIHWPEDRSIPKQIIMKAYEHPTMVNVGQDDPDLGQSPCGAGLGRKYDQLAATESNSNKEKLKTVVMRTLKRLHAFRGHLTLSIRLGTFVVAGCQWEDRRFKVSDFKSMIKDEHFAGYVTEEIGDMETEGAALLRLKEADDLIVPQDALTESVADVLPMYSADFVFADNEKTFCYTVTWQQMPEDSYSVATFDVIASQWSRLDPNANTAHGELDDAMLKASLANLNNGSAWQFDIKFAEVIEERSLPKHYANFAKSLHVDINAAREPLMEKLFIKYNPIANLKSIQQRIVHRYNISSCEYSLDVCRFQDRMYESKGVLAQEVAVYEPRWKLEVSRVQWKTTFGENEHLPIGETAGWNDDVEEWFPADHGNGDGWVDLMATLSKVEKVVRP